jgi:hypothetical protein
VIVVIFTEDGADLSAIGAAVEAAQAAAAAAARSAADAAAAAASVAGGSVGGGGSPAPVDTGGTGGPTASPGAVLDIGPGPTQNHFDVQIAPNSGAWFQKSMADIAAGFTDPDHFYVDGDAVVFRPRADGPTTSGSSYPRDELREVNADGSKAKFDALTGEHILSGKTTIAHVPANDPDVVIAQLHNGDADRIAIRTQLFSTGKVALGVRINGSLHPTRFEFPWLGPGREFEWKIRLIDGVAEIYFNDMTTPLISSTALVPTTHPDGWYFKAGAYAQFNTSAAGATGLPVAAGEYAEVRLRDLHVYHSGAAAS